MVNLLMRICVTLPQWVKKNFDFQKSLIISFESLPYQIGVTATELTPVKYECDIQQATDTFIITENGEIVE